MTTPRSSGAESQTSARVAGGTVGGAGIPSTPAQTPVDKDGTAAGGVIGGVPTLGGPGVRATAGATASSYRSRRVWRGDLYVEGQSLCMMRSVVGIQHDLPTKAPIGDTNGWPRQLDLNSTKLKSSTQVLDWMKAPESQWYIRFVHVNKKGQEREDLKVRQLVMVMMEQRLVFEIKCNEGVGTPGTLYVWGTPLQPYGPSLLGVFKPDEPRTIGLMGPPLTTPRSSGAESQTSARVAGGTVGGAGIPSTPAQTPVDKDGTAAGGVIGGVPTLGGHGVRATAGATASGERSRRVWRGDLYVEGQRLCMMRSIVGIQHDLPTKAPIGDTNGWPRQLDLKSTKLKSRTQVLDWMNAPESQWYVRFIPVDNNGQEREDLKVRQLVMVMVEQQVVFEIKCNEGLGTPGTLYVCGTPLQPHGPSLLGVFKPGA